MRATFTSQKAYASVVYSAAELTGASYDVYVKGSATGRTIGPYSVGGSVVGATKLVTVNVDSAVAGGMGGGRR